MIRFLVPLFVVAVAGIIFFNFTDPVLKKIDVLRAERDRLNVGLENAKKLREVQQQLLDTYNSYARSDLDRLNKFLPDNVDNVRLIIDINNIAKPYGMSIKNLKLKTTEDEATAPASRSQTGEGNFKGSVRLGFAVSGPYQNFKAFLADLARSLRLVDVATIGFGSQDKDDYDYTVEIQTYWLK